MPLSQQLSDSPYHEPVDLHYRLSKTVGYECVQERIEGTVEEEDKRRHWGKKHVSVVELLRLGPLLPLKAHVVR